MRYGIVTSNLGEYADPRVAVRVARAAEAAGWEAFFVWDHLVYRHPDQVAQRAPALAEVVQLVVARGLVEAQAVEVVVHPVELITSVCDR